MRINMQRCAGIKEDLRQPPYLCPVCEGKVGRAVAGELGGGKEEQADWLKGGDGALREFCEELERRGWGVGCGGDWGHGWMREGRGFDDVIESVRDFNEHCEICLWT